jgi:outer membrane biosynthesis protein TonB
MKHGLLTAFCCGLSSLAHAQTYSAPGMPLHLQRRPPAAQKAAAETPHSIIRFWKLRDSAYVKAAGPFYQYLGRRFQWPSSTLKAGIEGQITVSLIVLPDGTVGGVEIAHRALKQVEGFLPDDGLEKGTAALETEAMQFMKKLRFEPAATTDTILVPLSLKIQ